MCQGRLKEAAHHAWISSYSVHTLKFTRMTFERLFSTLTFTIEP